jgi:hypothetical protein
MVMSEPSEAPIRPHPSYPPDTSQKRLCVYDRVRRWQAATDPRIVRRFWPVQRDGSRRPYCPVCGVTVPEGRASQVAVHLPPGPAREALAVGGLAALTPELPIEPGELWYSVCRACLQDRSRIQSDRWLPEWLRVLVDEALRGD